MIFSNSSGYPHAALQPRVNTVWALPISLAATFGISGGSLLFLISFPELLRWFSSLSVAFLPYFIQVQNVGITPNGLPHSAIQGSQDMCSFPWLFAAYHGLLRLVAPRHPPYTSIRLTILSFLLQSSLSLITSLVQASPSIGLKLTVQTKGCTIHSGVEQRVLKKYFLLRSMSHAADVCGLSVSAFRLLPSRTIKELSKLSRVHYKRVYFYVPFPDCVKYHCASLSLQTPKRWRIGDSNP